MLEDTNKELAIEDDNKELLGKKIKEYSYPWFKYKWVIWFGYSW